MLSLGNNSSGLMLNKGGKKQLVQANLKLTSMIDMFTILLVFLLKSFSADGQILTLTDDLQLPESSAQTAPQAASVIAVTDEWVLLDGKKIVSVAELEPVKELIIPNLLKELKDLRVISEGVGELSAAMGFTGKVAIQGDKEIPYHLLKKVMFTCGQVGYNDMMLAVMKNE